MPTRKIQEPLLEQSDTIPRWKLSHLASELHQNKEHKDLHGRIWAVLKQSGLHPLGKIKANCLQVQDWILLSAIWREMYLGTMARKEKSQYLAQEEKERRQETMKQKRLIIKK